MIVFNVLVSFFLQVDVRSFSLGGDPGGSSNEVIIIIIAVIVTILVIIIINAVKGKSSSSGGAVSGLFSGFVTGNIANSIGLSSEQKKMLKFALKTDGVTDPQKSINNSSLLDGHFKRAYKTIEQKAGSDDEAQRKLSVLFSTRNAIEHRVAGDLTSTRQLKEDITLKITAVKEKYSVSVITSKGESLATECPKNALGSLIKFQKGDKVNAMFSTRSNKVFSFETHILGYSKTFGQNTLLLAHSNKLKFHSQRRFRRRSLAVSCNLYVVHIEGTKKNQRLVVDKRHIKGNLVDISVGGCSIKANAPVNTGTKIKIEFSMGEINIAALGQVLRTNRSGMVTVTHIKFLKVARKSMNRINAYVYEFIND